MTKDQDPTILVLASASPRRRELLERLKLAFTVQSADLDETPRPGEAPHGYVKRLAREKAASVARTAPGGSLILAADTSVVLADRIFGKPQDDAEAREMLSVLAGKTHSVLTGVALAGAFFDSRVVETRVTFRTLSPAEIAWYVGTGEPQDKAGAYAIQGAGAFLISRIDGSPTNVIGLPLTEVLEMLEKSALRLPWSAT